MSWNRSHITFTDWKHRYQSLTGGRYGKSEPNYTSESIEPRRRSRSPRPRSRERDRSRSHERFREYRRNGESPRGDRVRRSEDRDRPTRRRLSPNPIRRRKVSRSPTPPPVRRFTENSERKRKLR